MENTFNILYYIYIYKKWYKTIINLVAISMFFTLIFSLSSPVKYVSSVTIISTNAGGDTGLASIGKFLGISNISGMNSSNDMIEAMLKSRRMAKNIKEFSELNNKPIFSYSISTISIAAGLRIDVKGNDPVFTQKVANFAIANLDKINEELNITPSKPMVKVLDPASSSARESRNILQKLFVAAIGAFLIISFYIFFEDYLRRIKGEA